MLDACLRSWPWDPWLLASCILSIVVYGCGWRHLRQHDPARWAIGRLISFAGGLLAIYLALASPIEPLASLLLQVHMIQHLLLVMVAPPLIWLAAPQLPMLWGLPKSLRTQAIGPWLRWPAVRRFARWLVHPATALALFILSNLLWHVPASYELALRSPPWHYLQHLCFFGTGLIFWHPVVQPYPSRVRWSNWLLLPYLLLADIQNTVLSALLTFSSKVLYPYYDGVPRLGNITALEDQATAGVIMWVPGSVAFLGPLFWIGLSLLYGSSSGTRRTRKAKRARIAAPKPLPQLTVLQNAPAMSSSGDGGVLLRFLRWRHARLVFQVPLFLIALFVIYDGLMGPQASPLNLAGVLPWIHWRGIVVLGLMAAGNLSCMACPFTLPRKMARRWLPQGYAWPRPLRSKWLAVTLVGIFLWSYEALALWDSPWWTASITLGYFGAAFVVDGFFRESSFCKYVCPIGQFNFVQSLVSPVEVAVRDPQICTTCRTKDCIRGREEIPGCQLDLFQPKKSGNMDCTFCLDCVQACPHTNVGLVAHLPGTQLGHDRLRSGIGRLSARTDIAALVLVLVFGAFANAGGMVRPVVEWQQQLQTDLGWSPRTIITLYYAMALLVVPVLAAGLASIASHPQSYASPGYVRVATRYAYALVPLGFGMWLAHYSFHLFTSYETIIPTTQRFAADAGFTGLGTPEWNCACCAPVAGWLLRAELLFLDVGFLLSLYTGYRMASEDRATQSQAFRTFLPWGLLITLLFLVGVWLVFQPMQMRGTMMMDG